MPFQAGDPVPDFEVEDIDGNTISSRALRGRTWLLSFFRYSTCALCNLRVHELIQRYPAYHRLGLEIVAVFESPASRIRANVGKQRVPFALVGDPEARLYDLFQVETSPEKMQASMDREDLKTKVAAAAAIGYPLAREEGANFFRMPADVLIGPDGRIRTSFYSNSVGEHLAWHAIDASLSAGGRNTVQ